MCRKWTAALIAQFLVVSPEQFQPSLNTFPAYKEYLSSPGRYRGFCSECGSSLIWRSEDDTRTFDLYLGTVDEEWLVESEVGRRTADGAIASVLARPNGTQFWM